MLISFIKKRFFWIVLPFILMGLFTHCGNDSDENTSNAILEAEIFLSSGNCQAAIDVLEAAGRDTDNARYLITLASGYACRGGFSTPTFFGTDLPLVGSPATLGGFVRFTTSPLITEPRDENYEDILEAINILLYAGGGIDADRNPTIARRSAIFNSDDQKEIRAFLTYLLMSHVGQYLYFYGNGSTTGVKGTRVGGGNTCLADYSNLAITNPAAVGGNATLNSYLDDATFPNGTCSSAGTGSSDLGTAGSLDISRMCQLVVGLNNLFEVLPVFLNDVTGDTSFNGLGPVDTATKAAITVLTTAQPSTTTLTQTQSQTLCEQNNSTDTELQYFFALLVEILFV